MNIAEAKEQIKDTVDGYLDRDETGVYEIPPEGQRPLFLLGAPGIGKTAIVGQVAAELGIGLVSYSMTHHTRQSALGLPFIVHKEYRGHGFDVSEYTMSEIIASIYDYMERTGHERGILFLDEINCVSETLYPSMLQFLQFKTFGRHRVPDGWVVVCAGNPPEYNKSVYEFDVVTLDRLRKIVVEPDLGAWLEYASATGVHPAVVTYLQVKQDQFYSVETTTAGKSFVTARGWDDLSRIVKLFEKKGKRVDRALVEQFLQDEDIAEHFAQYYALFTKYRSDYQVGAILSGNASEDIRARARSARLDERFALVRLILDALGSDGAETMEWERVVSIERDVLREAKPSILAGENAAAVVAAAADELVADARRRVEAQAAADADVRPERLAASALRDCALMCEQARVVSGDEAFAIAGKRYGEDADKLKKLTNALSSRLDNAFAFLGDVFGDGREMNAFVADLAARPALAQYLAMFGNDAFHKHNASVHAVGGKSALDARVEEFDLDAAAEAQALENAARNCGGCSGC